MAERQKPVRLSLNRGVDTRSRETDVPEGFVRDAVNVDLARDNVLRRRGWRQALALTNARSLFAHDTLYCVEDGVLTAIDPVTLGKETLGTVGDADTSFCVHAGMVYLTNPFGTWRLPFAPLGLPTPPMPAIGLSTWPDDMLASYRTLNPEQAVWFDANPAIEAELLARLQPGGYLHTTFGQSGQNKTVCDFVFLLLTTGDIASRTITKSGDALRWDIDGTVTTQNDLPAHTLAGAGILTCSTTDGWTGLTGFQINSNSFSGPVPKWTLPNVTNFNIRANQFSGAPPLWDFPAVLIFNIGTNQFSGTPPLWVFPVLTEFYIFGNDFTGTAPAWNFPAATVFQLSFNGFSDIAAPLPNLTAVADLRALSNGLSQAAVDAALLALYTNRLNYTDAAPAFQVHLTNAAPSGIYQANCPTAQTGKEYQYHLVNDPCADGHNLWTITANV